MPPTCSACRQEISALSRFCPGCGAAQTRRCAGCNAPMQSGFAFCPDCGARAEDASMSASAPADARGRTPAAAQAITPDSAPDNVPSAPIPIPPQAAPTVTGERRVVTVLFADLSGFTRMSEQLDPEIVTGMLNRLFARFQSLANRYEGRVDKYIGDAAMLIFGAPVGHEDDPERAVLTALEMLQSLPEVNGAIRRELGVDHPLRIHIGIATGLVVAGRVGVREAGGGDGYTVMGDAVNLAARLNDLARPGEILIAESTWNLVRGRINAEPAQTVAVKGKQAPVAVYRVLGADLAGGDARGLAQFHSPLVGRESEISRLLDAFLYLREGAGCFITVEGNAGVGKSRLVRECLSRRAGSQTLPELHAGRCISYGRQVPYYPWSQILASLLQTPAVGDLASEETRLLDEIVRGNFIKRAQEDAERHREQVFRLVPALIARACVISPRVLLLEDMHWADRSSIDLLLALAPLIARHPLMLLTVYRPGLGEDLSSRLRELGAGVRAGVVAIALAPLEPAPSRALVDNLTSAVRDFPDSLRREISHRSQGVPLFIEEILRSYVDERIIVQSEPPLPAPGGLHPGAGSGEPWRCNPERLALAATLVPASLHALLAARVDRLDEDARARLQMAAVIGKDFSAATVDRLLSLPHDPGAWNRLVAEGELQWLPAAPDGIARARFGSALTQEVIYATLLKSRRQALHLAVAADLETDEAGRGGNFHSLAHHFEQAEQPARAAAYWYEAAGQARAVYANDEALTLYARAAALDPDGDSAFAALAGKARLLDSLGRSAEAAEGMDALLVKAQAAGKTALAVEHLCTRAYIAYHLGDGGGIVRFGENALTLARGLGDRRLMARALRVTGVGHEFACRYRAAVTCYDEQLALLADDPPSGEQASVFNSLGEIARACGRDEEAIGWYEKFLAVHERLHPGKPSATYLNNCGAAYVGLGQHRRALALLDERIAGAQETGYLSLLSETLYYRCLARLGLGRIAEAARDAGESWRLAREGGEREMMALALRAVALVHRDGGQAAGEELPPTPQSCLEHSIVLLMAAGKPGEEARSRLELGRLLAAAGDTAAARAEFTQAGERFTVLEMNRLAAEAQEAAARC